MFTMDVRGHGGIKDLIKASGYLVLDQVLDCADIVFKGYGKDQEEIWIGIEIKETNDLLSSLRSGRLFEQTGSMLNTYDISLLVIYGQLTVSVNGQLRTDDGFKPSPPWPNIKSLNGALLSIQNGGVIVPLIQPDEAAAAGYIIQAYEWYQKKEHRGLFNRRKDFVLGGTDQLYAMHIVTGIPKVSATLARRLLEHFGSPLAVLSATEEDLTKVHGIGKKLAKTIYDSARTRWLS